MAFQFLKGSQLTTVSSKTLGKDQRLRARAQIQSLFDEGKSLFVHPIKLVYTSIPDAGKEDNLLFGVTVPKKLYKRAVDRNQLKRLIREAYRTTNDSLREEAIKSRVQIALMYIYVIPQKENYNTIKKAMKKLHQKLALKIGR